MSRELAAPPSPDARGVGYGPKCYANVIRFQATLHGMEQAPRRSTAVLAADNGYFDQAHLAIVVAAGLIMRASWPAYASVADAMTFSLPMLLARLSIGALATLAAGWIATAIAPRSRLVGLLPGVILLVAFIPQHIMLWKTFPVWYHLTFLLSLVPLTYAGGTISRGTR